MQKLKARVDVNFARVEVNFQKIIVTNSATDFFVLISLSTKVPLIIHTKFQPNIPSHSGEKVDFMVLLFLISAAILDPQPG